MVTITGTTGNDIIDEAAQGGVTNQSSTINALAGDDLIISLRKAPYFVGPTPFSIADTVDGGDGIDTLRIGTLLNNWSLSGGFFTEFGVGGANWTVSASNVEQFDIITARASSSATFGNGNDRLDASAVGYTGTGNYSMGAGDDTALFSRSYNTIDMGSGNDLMSIDYSWTGNAVYLTQGFAGSLATGYSSTYYIAGNPSQTSFSGVERFNIASGTGADTLQTGDGDDSIASGAGNDAVIAGAGNDIVDGGLGTDTLSIDLSDEAQGVAIDLSLAGAQQVGGTGSITGFESFAGSVKGSAFGDSFIETIVSYDATFDTGAGDDLVQVARGTDTVNMGAGNDRLVLNYAHGNAVYMSVGLTGSLAAGYAGTYYIAGNPAQAAFTGVENFTITTAQSGDTLFTGDGNDVISTAAGNDEITVAGGTNIVDGGIGTDALSIDLSGQAQATTINLALAGEQLSGGTGSVTNVESFIGSVVGSAFGDTLIETAVSFAATFDTGAGDDLVQVARGSDAVNMGAGNDRLVLNYTHGNAVYMTVALTGSLAAGYAGTYYIAGNPAQAAFTGVENFTITTAQSADALFTGDGNDVIATAAGNDEITVAGGTNIVDGGADVDALSIDLSGQTQGTTINLALAGEQLSGGTGSVTNVESFIGSVVGSAFADTLIETAVSFAATFDTGAGDDLVAVARGSDTVNMGDGNDRLVLNYTHGNAVYMTVGLTGSLAAGYAGTYYIAGNPAQASFTGVENFTITTAQSGDTLFTGDGNDVISTAAGNDEITVAGGTNIVDGGADIDALSIDLSGQAQGVTINLALAGAQQSGGTGSVTNVESFIGSVVGSAFADTLIETAVSFAANFDTGDGDDVVQVARGSDTIAMGAGNDRLVLNYTHGNAVYMTVGLTGSLAAGYAGTYYIAGNPAQAAFTGVENFTITTAQSADTLTTGDGNDVINAGAGGDAIVVAGGNDTVDAGDGNDSVDGGAGNDILGGGLGIDLLTYASATAGITISLAIATAQATGGSGSDTVSGFENVTGSAYNDVLTGDGGNNILSGGDGDDILVGGAGNDTLGGGNGVDSVSFAGATSAVNVNFATSTITGGAGIGSDTLSSIEGAVGTNFNDSLTGNAGANNLSGSGGNDTIDGGAGDDMIEGGIGNDTLAGGNGVDTLTYASATARVVVNLSTVAGQSTVGAGTDTVSGFENLIGTAFNDTLSGTATANVIAGGLGLDLINGLGGNDTLLGGDGNDTLQGGDGDDSIDGGAGATDIASYAAAATEVTVSLLAVGAQATGGAGNDTLTGIEGLLGSAFDDTLTGDANANSLSGGTGNDTISGDLGNDFIDGGSGLDTLDYSLVGAGITLNLISQSAQNTGGAGSDTVRGIENVIGTAFNDVITGNEFGNVFTGGDGDDALVGGLGNDTLNGGAGIDTANYASATAGVKVNLTILTAQSTVGAGSDTLSGIENLNGTGFDDQFTGDGANNNLVGNGGNDLLVGGNGDDIVNGGAGSDTASYATATTGVTVNLATATAQNTIGAGFDTFLSIENLVGSTLNDTLTGSTQVNTISGGTGDDTIDGGSSNDIVDGGSGNDILLGGNGDDLLTPGAGNDSVNGGAGIDTILYGVTAGGVTVNLGLATAQTVGGGQGIDTIVNVENISGSTFGDTLTGSAVANVLTGGGGKDTLAGAGGNDRFVYLATGDSTVGANADRITDLNAGDILDLSGIDANANTVGTNEAFAQVAAFSNVAGQFTLAFDGGSNTTTLLGDTDGNGVADFSVLFTGDVTALTGSWVL